MRQPIAERFHVADVVAPGHLARRVAGDLHRAGLGHASERRFVAAELRCDAVRRPGVRYGMALNQATDNRGPATTTLLITPAFRMHMGCNWYLLAGIDVPVTNPQPYDFQPTVGLTNEGIRRRSRLLAGSTCRSDAASAWPSLRWLRLRRRGVLPCRTDCLVSRFPRRHSARVFSSPALHACFTSRAPERRSMPCVCAYVGTTQASVMPAANAQAAPRNAILRSMLVFSLLVPTFTTAAAKRLFNARSRSMPGERRQSCPYVPTRFRHRYQRSVVSRG